MRILTTLTVCWLGCASAVPTPPPVPELRLDAGEVVDAGTPCEGCATVCEF